uniref:Chorion peroxidase n=1 Tax=Scolopendra viridis TaxID=118503 RepID=A0A4D5R9W0_SCOVI
MKTRYRTVPCNLYFIFVILGFVMSQSTETKLEDDEITNERTKRDIACLRLRFRRIDGSCNNVDNPNWGKSRGPYLRFLSPDYADGVGEMRRSKLGRALPGARLVSLNMVRDVNNEHPVISHMLMQWGQLINHDVSKKRSKEVTCCDDGMTILSNNPNCVPILLPSDDPTFRKRCLSFSRSDFVMVNGKREQINDVTAFVDASPVYGSTENIARSLRSFNGGKLNSLLRPFGKELLPTMRSDPSSFSSGDSRTNMLPSLVIVHVLLLREHNRLAENLARINPHWNDEALYQEARRIVSALVQQITYREFLPLVLGFGNMRPLALQNNGYFENYNPSLNPTIGNVFAVAAYRFGHSLVQSHLKRFTLNVRELPSPPLAVEFFNVSSVLNQDGEVDRIVLGLLNQKSQQADSSFTGQIHHNLFGTGGSGSDLYAINIQRARDHGIPGYNSWRQFCGFPRFTEFSELNAVMRADVVNVLRNLYNNIDDIDIYAAGMAEFPIQGGLVGPTFACIITRQFQNLKHGDRYWYENGRQSGSFSPDQLREIRKVSLARIICDNTDLIKSSQPEVMKVPSGSNQLTPCQNLPQLDLRMWREGNERENAIVQQQVNPFAEQRLKEFQRPVQRFQPFQPSQQLNNNVRPQTVTAAQDNRFINGGNRVLPNENVRPFQNQIIESSNIRPSFQEQQNEKQRFLALVQQQQQSLKQKLQQQQQQQLQQNLQRRPGNLPFNRQSPLPSQQNNFRNNQIIAQQPFFNTTLNNRGTQPFNRPGTSPNFSPLQPNRQVFQPFSPFVRPSQNLQSFQRRFSSDDNQIEPVIQNLFREQQNLKPVHIFFAQGGEQSIKRLSKLRNVKPQPGVIFRVPGLSKDDDDQGGFGFIAAF